VSLADLILLAIIVLIVIALISASMKVVPEYMRIVIFRLGGSWG
jgi:regulator of protease activity HflC (stomatin/prohibitin superfamily)